MVTRTIRDMDEGQAPDGGTIKYLKVLVTVLTVTMIFGFLTIVVIFVMRFGTTSPLDLPDRIALPVGTEATAFTQGEDWFAVVTDGSEILVYSRGTGELRQRIQITPE